MFDPTYIFITFILSLLGYAVFRYGKNVGKVSWIVSGIAMCVFPYFVTNVVAILGISAGLIVIPYFLAF